MYGTRAPAYSLSASPAYSVGLLSPKRPVVNIAAFVSQEEMSSTLQEPVLTERLIVTFTVYFENVKTSLSS